MKHARQPHALHQIFAAYLHATGFTYTLSSARIADLREILSRGITSADVALAISHLQRRIRRGDNGCTAASLTWRNAMAPDKLEDHLQLAREAAKKAPRKAVSVPDEAHEPKGTELQDTDAIRKEGAAGLRALREQLAGRTSAEVNELPSAKPVPRALPAPRP
jgi:hypothetical protein